MNYEMRSRLRNECMKFLRFAYQLDFLAMHSLKNVYSASVDELRAFLHKKVEEPEVYMLRENVREVKSVIEPLFAVTLSHSIVPVSPVGREKI